MCACVRVSSVRMYTSLPVRVVVKYRYLYLSTILSVLDVLEYLIGKNEKYLYLIQSTW